MNPRLHPGVGGFALAAVLWLLAGIAVVVAGVSEAVKQAAVVNRELRERVLMLQAEQLATADLTYLAGTHRGFGGGLQIGPDTLRLDAASYKLHAGLALEDIAIELQDASGLLHVSEGDPSALARLLTQCGPDLDEATKLAESAADYSDLDDLKRINGAERFDYSGQGLPPPSNRRLNHANQLAQVLNWPGAMQKHRLEPCLSHTVLGEPTQLNVWTASPQVLMALGMSATAAESAVQERRAASGQILSPQLLAFGNLSQNRPGGFTRFGDVAGASVRVRLVHLKSGQTREFLWLRSSAGQLQPFWLTHARWLPAQATSPSLSAASTATLTSFIEQSIANPDKPNAPATTLFSR